MDGEELFVGESVTGNVTKMEVYAALGREQAAEIIERIVAQGREDVSSRMREMAERGENARSLFRFCFLAEKVADL